MATGKEGSVSGSNKGRKIPSKSLPDCRCGHCPVVETYSDCCWKDKRAASICEGKYKISVFPFQETLEYNAINYMVDIYIISLVIEV